VFVAQRQRRILHRVHNVRLDEWPW
jgi:hypothetical protein